MITRPRLIALVITLSAVILATCLWVNEGPLWRLVMLKTSSYEGTEMTHQIRGWIIANRWTGLIIKSVDYYVETGFIATTRDWVGSVIQVTYYTPDGVVSGQEMYYAQGSGEKKLGSTASPPWRWEAKDQNEPTAPWWTGKDL